MRSDVRKSEPAAADQARTCPECGMRQDDWDDEQGFASAGQLYCCEGCAIGSGCTCG